MKQKPSFFNLVLYDNFAHSSDAADLLSLQAEMITYSQFSQKGEQGTIRGKIKAEGMKISIPAESKP